jgi:hypothetical protein
MANQAQRLALDEGEEEEKPKIQYANKEYNRSSSRLLACANETIKVVN